MVKTLRALIAGCLLAMMLPAVAEGDKPRVLISTSMGDFVIELAPERAPLNVANFLQYVDDGFYDNTVFHRVIRRFAVQGGGYTPDYEKKRTRAPVLNESKGGLRNERWTVAMARPEDPNGATSQFFVNMKLNLSLDYQKRTPGYTVIGKVIDGRDVVRSISVVKTRGWDEFEDLPIEPVILHSARRLD